LRKEIEADLRRQLSAEAEARARRAMEAAVAEARQAGRREGRGDSDRELKRVQQQLKAARQERSAEELRRRGFEQTVRKLEQKLSNASPQRKGAVSQEEVRRSLQAMCPNDALPVIQPGRRGGDILQTVREHGHSYGKILWEVKETAEWSESYIAKARSDSQRSGADYVCLVTSSFPRGAEGFVVRQRVVVIAPQYAGFLARVLREALVELGQAKLAAQQRTAKATRILDYLGSADCKARFEIITDSVDSMRKNQANERNYHDEHWRKEEHAFSQIATATSAIHGSLSAIARNSR
jgi:hypothetical protein